MKKKSKIVKPYSFLKDNNQKSNDRSKQIFSSKTNVELNKLFDLKFSSYYLKNSLKVEMNSSESYTEQLDQISTTNLYCIYQKTDMKSICLFINIIHYNRLLDIKSKSKHPTSIQRNILTEIDIKNIKLFFYDMLFVLKSIFSENIQKTFESHPLFFNELQGEKHLIESKYLQHHSVFNKKLIFHPKTLISHDNKLNSCFFIAS